MFYIVIGQRARPIHQYLHLHYIIVAELKMRWSDIMMFFIVTETAGAPSRDFPVNKEKTLGRGVSGVMKGN